MYAFHIDCHQYTSECATQVNNELAACPGGHFSIC